MRWVARLAARRVVWIIVGLVVYAALNAVGVQAAPVTTALTFPGTSDSGPGVVINRLSGLFDMGDTGGVTVVLTDVTFNSVGNIGVYCSSGVNVYDSATDGTHAFTVAAGATGCRVYSYAGGTFRDPFVGAGTYAYDSTAPDPTPTPTPTPTASPTPTATPSPDPSASPTATPTATPAASAGPLCEPYCNVALVPEDRARLDNAFELDGYIASVSALLLTAILVVTGLRR